MKTKASWRKVLGVAGVTALACGLWLLGSSRGSGKHGREAGAGVSLAATNGASNLDRTKQDSQWREAYGKLPLSFEENVGETAQEVRYVSHGAGYELFLTPQEAVLALRTPISHDLSPRHRFKTMRAIREALRARKMTAVRMRFEGANPAGQINATDRLLKKTNYFIGSDPKKWRANVPSYARVKYADIYPGVDLIFYGNQRQLEYDFVVAPGADPKAIRLALEGARKLRISARGDVVLSVAGGEVVLQKPVVYQMLKGQRHEISGRYILTKDRRVSFSVPSYDRSEPLILDPVLNYSTYLGGSSDEGGGGSQSFGIAVDANGNVFVAGTTFSTDFPTTAANAYNAGPLASNPSGEVFVTEMNPTGTAELYSTYLAGANLTGTGGEFGVALALDPAGKIYVTGLTFSSDFPTTDGTIAGTLAGFKQSPNPTNDGVGTSFISKIDPAISGAGSLVYSSYIGGTGGSAALADFGNGIAADASGNAYVTGITLSPPNAGPVFALTDFPVINAYQPAPSDVADGNAFLTRIDTTQAGNASLIYSTYLGGAGANALNLGFADAGFGVAVDSSKNAYIVGTTSSTDFPMTSPTPNGFQTTSPAGNTQGTGFLAKIDTTQSGGASLVYSTYLGGEVFDFGIGIALGPNNVAYATGTTNSLLFPTTIGAFRTTGNTNGVAFVTLVDAGIDGAGSKKYSTFLGGASGNIGNAIRADGAGNAYVVGTTTSANFPVTPGAFEPVLPGAAGNGFVSKISPGGSGAADLVYSTFFGGNGTSQEQVLGIALDTANPPNAYITGQTFSTAASFPIFPSTAFQTTLNGPSDAFIAKLTLIPTLLVSPTALNFGTILIPNTSAPQSVTLTNNTNAAMVFTSALISGGSPAAANTDYAVSANTCGVSIAAGASCTVSVTFKPTVAGVETANLVLTDGDSTSPQTISLTGTGTNTAPDFTVTAPGTATVKNGSSVNFTVTVTPVGGFTSQVDLTCASVPALTLGTCTPSPASVTTTDGVTPKTSTVTVTTTAFMPPPSRRIPPLSMRQVVPLFLAVMLLFLLPTTRRLRMRLTLGTAMILFVVQAGCSGKPHPHTQKGSYVLTVTGTLHGGATTHSATVNLTVN